MRAWAVSAAFAAIASSASVAAQEPIETGAPPETVTADEPQQVLRGPLFISPMGEPFRASSERPQPPILIWFAAVDSDGDGKLSQEEFVSQARAFFVNRLDANRDGSATSFESTALWREDAPEMLTGQTPLPRPALPPRGPGGPGGGGPGGPGGPGGGMGGGGPPGGGIRPPRDLERAVPIRIFGITNDAEPVMSCDLDLSRRVTREEFEACAVRRFEALDTNGDGFFEIAESERARALAEGGPPRMPPR